MYRLFIVLPVYAAVVIFLPRQDWFRQIADPILQIPPDTSFWASMAFGAAASLGLWVVRSRPMDWMFRRPRIATILGSGLLGVIFSAVFDLFERLSGASTNLVTMILLPTGFMLSEAVYLAVRWRLYERED